ncbi:MAG: hypothetical protein WCE21_00725 [Candidatus Babeliales bacterium]
MQKQQKTVFTLCVSVILISAALAFGVQPRFFNLFSLGMPSAITLFGVWALVPLMLASALLPYSALFFLGLSSRFMYLPTLVGSWYFSKGFGRSGVTLLLMAACMILFVIHPVGADAWFYPLYWVIPVLISLTATDMVFARSLATVFVMHAVGSVLWLYTVPTTPDLYRALMPIVPFERLALAAAMTLIHYLFVVGYHFCKTHKQMLSTSWVPKRNMWSKYQ